jgi:hypothetical protein
MQGVAAGLVAVALSLAGVTPGWLGHRLVAEKRALEAPIEWVKQLLADPDREVQTFRVDISPAAHEKWLRDVLADTVNSRAAPATIRTVMPFAEFCRIEADTADGPLVLSHGSCEPRHQPGDKVEIFGHISPPPVGGAVDPHVLNPAYLEEVGTIARLSRGRRRADSAAPRTPLQPPAR